MNRQQRGFSLIELLIVITIISILIVILLIMLDPAARFRDARNAARMTDIVTLLGVTKLYQIDHGADVWPQEMRTPNDAEVYMITTTPQSEGCDALNGLCETDVSSSAHCVSFDEYVAENYILAVPISPPGTENWGGEGAYNPSFTGYTLEVDRDSGFITVRACESEGHDEILIGR